MAALLDIHFPDKSVALAVQVTVEVGIWCCDAVKTWMMVIIILTNGWGMLDAFMRFPLVKDIDSLFGLKQIALLTMKLAAYALGFREIGKNVGWFVLAILCCVFTLPIVWLTALPIGDVQSYHQKHDVVDEDIAMRLWRIIAHPASEDRAAARSFCRRVAIQTLVLLVRIAPPLRPAILKLDPSLGRVLGKAAAV
eukprot:TRINITY_DN42355_c0_g1_i7.p1 TRINITY_DN42355_c0_g1~~TRINITY_DN42355_c0_g1_i7.p1  ORF type:complete len:195 (-),score=34.94 TRINITY_DN42355_c0_g1_i7:92-676(-)